MQITILYHRRDKSCNKVAMILNREIHKGDILCSKDVIYPTNSKEGDIVKCISCKQELDLSDLRTQFCDILEV